LVKLQRMLSQLLLVYLFDIVVEKLDSLIRDETVDQADDDDEPQKVQEVNTKQTDPNILKTMQSLDKNEIFNQFKEKEGKEYNETVLKNIAALKEKKQEIKDLSEQCQQTKEHMDRLKFAIAQKQETKNQEV